MKLQTFLQAKAKQYPSLSFEMKIVFALIFIAVNLCITIATLTLNFAHSLTSTRKSILAFKRKQKKTKGAHNLQVKKNPLSLLIRSTKPHRGRPKKVTLQHNKKKSHSSLFPLPFTIKLRYFLLGVFFSFIFLFLPLLVFIYLQNLPNPKELTLRQIPQTTKIYDRNGVLLHQIYASQNRTLIPLSQIPRDLQEATLAIEDKNFYKHPGFDITSIIRAFKVNSLGGSIQGGSTITQQLIKSSLLTPEPSIIRKIKEVTLAFWAERIYSKNQILEMYFNQVPYGGTAWGVEAAAEVYFDKHVKDLDLAECAFLAGITAAPTAYSPYGPNPQYWKMRQAEVLKHMQQLGFISSQQQKAAIAENIVFKHQGNPQYAPHFVNYITDQLIKKYGLATVEKGGLTVRTTLDVQKQQEAQKIVKEEVDKSAYLNLTNGAALITNPQNGDILAMVGSKDFSDPEGGNVNVTTSYRQPGSTIKVVTYSAAFSHGLTAASVIDDTPTVFHTPSGPYAPVNYDGHYYGRVPLRFALANSLNVPAVKVLSQVGIPTMVELAKDMGVSSWKNPDSYGLSVTLGGSEVTMLDMATVFGTLANQGNKVMLDPILKVTDSKGTVLDEKKPVKGKQVIDPGVAFIISNILADNLTRVSAFGPHSVLEIPGHTVSVKTGTTDNKRDNWTIGYTNNYVVTVWVGNNNGSPMNPSLASGITGAAPIWNRIMTSLLTRTPEKQPTIAADIIQRVCSGKIEYFLQGTEQQSNCTNFLAPTTYSTRNH